MWHTLLEPENGFYKILIHPLMAADLQRKTEWWDVWPFRVFFFRMMHRRWFNRKANELGVDDVSHSA